MTRVDVAIIGAGSGGFIAARRAAQLGMRCVVIERRHVGGVCLNRGCVPTKTMLQAATIISQMGRAGTYGVRVGKAPPIDYPVLLAKREHDINYLRGGMENLLADAGVPIIAGDATFVGPNSLSISPAAEEALAAIGKPGPFSERVEADHIIVATGSRPAGLPCPGAEHPRVIDSDGLLALRHLPKSILVIGAGAIGCEWSHILAALGCQVSLVTRRDHVLPRQDADISAVLENRLDELGVATYTKTHIASVTAGENDVTAQLEGDRSHSVTTEYILAATGRLPLTEGLGLDVIGVQTEGQGWVRVDGFARTNVPSVLAIGDVTGQCLLAHAAFRQGVVAIEKLAGLDPEPVCVAQIPKVVYTEPEVASVGLTEKEALALGLNFAVGIAPGDCNARAVTRGQIEGFTKVIAEAGSGRIIGVHMVRIEAGELIAEAVSAVEKGWTAAELGEVVRPHPALCESLGEAALAAAGRPLFFPHLHCGEADSSLEVVA